MLTDFFSLFQLVNTLWLYNQTIAVVRHIQAGAFHFQATNKYILYRERKETFSQSGSGKVCAKRLLKILCFKAAFIISRKISNSVSCRMFEFDLFLSYLAEESQT